MSKLQMIECVWENKEERERTKKNCRVLYLQRSACAQFHSEYSYVADDDVDAYVSVDVCVYEWHSQALS